ncbi:ATP-dependent zinc metalloprotease FtsH [Candidatus Saccharibacteria bacterium]|nr:ATP-dependent zinc metalloprotease FtsH [Candidatus Saccharibacteria bacterium]
MKANWSRNAFLYLLILIAGVAIFYNTPWATQSPESITLTQLATSIEQGRVESVVVRGEEVRVYFVGRDQPLISRREAGVPLTQTLTGLGVPTTDLAGVKLQYDAPGNGSNWLALLINLLPLVFIAGLFFILFRQTQGSNNQALSFGKSKARLFTGNRPTITFDDIAGANEAKQELQEVVEFLKEPQKFAALGARIPKGVLLVGPPGTGKTLMAKAVSGEAGVPFFSISGSEFVEMFVGVGASRVRDLFAKAKKNAPCIIFVDEIDAVGRRRGSGMGGGHDEREQTLNQILVEMDGFEQGQNVIVLAATNRADVLDPALLRPGRFDRRVNIGLPDRKDRLAILKVHFAKKPLADGVDLDALAAKTAGSSGADLENIANESAIIAARHDRKTINGTDVTAAFEKVAIGPERKSKVMNDQEKEMTAYHEAGHAVVGHVLPDSDMVHKVTIIPRGGTGGVTWFIPPEDKSYHSIVEYKDVLARMLGGRIAEEIIYGPDRVTTGAGSDLQKAAELARDMVMNQGMGRKLRDQVFHVDEGMMLDRMVHERLYSDETAKIIDDEVEALITEAAGRAREVIKANRAPLDALKDALLAKETVEAEEVIELLNGSKLPKSATLY